MIDDLEKGETDKTWGEVEPTISGPVTRKLEGGFCFCLFALVFKRLDCSVGL